MERLCHVGQLIQKAWQTRQQAGSYQWLIKPNKQG
jgi:hypothetical protein